MLGKLLVSNADNWLLSNWLLRTRFFPQKYLWGRDKNVVYDAKLTVTWLHTVNHVLFFQERKMSKKKKKSSFRNIFSSVLLLHQIHI